MGQKGVNREILYAWKWSRTIIYEQEYSVCFTIMSILVHSVVLVLQTTLKVNNEAETQQNVKQNRKQQSKLKSKKNSFIE